MIDSEMRGFCYFVVTIAMSSTLSHAQGALMFKDNIFDMLEQCRPNHSRTEISENPDLSLNVECENKCIETKLNQWFSESEENKNTYFGTTNVYVIERAAGLRSCRENPRGPERSVCLAQWSPDIVAKIGEPGCGFAMDCEANFDIDDEGNPINASAKCPDGPAKKEFERETLCLLGHMSYVAHRGRMNVTQPFELTEPNSCPVS